MRREDTERYLIRIIENLQHNEFLNVFTWKDSKQGMISDVYFDSEECKDLDRILRLIESRNSRGTAVGYCTNPLINRRRADDSISRINNVFVDIDNCESQEELEKIVIYNRDVGMEPYSIQASGGGYHINYDVDLPIEESGYVENFLKHLKKYVSEKIDSKVFNPSRIQRLPGTTNFKHKKDVKIIMMKDQKDVQRQENTSALKTFTDEIKEAKKQPSTENKAELAEFLNRHDEFFTNFLTDNEAMKIVAEKEGIQKNDILFKNLAAFDVQTGGKYEEIIEDFVEQSGHIIEEYQGWIKKGMDINYDEIRNWVNDNQLDVLKPYIREQFQRDQNFLNSNYYCYLESIENEYRFILHHKKEAYNTKHSRPKLVEYLYLKSQEINVDLAKYFGLIFLDNWEKMDSTKKEAMIKRKIWDHIFLNNMIVHIYDYGYQPRKDMFFEDFGQLYFNEFKEGELEYFYEKKEIYEFPYIKRLLMHLVNNDRDGYDWVINWLSYILQNPLVKLPSSILFMGCQGIGKGRLREWVMSPIWGEWNIAEIDQATLDNIWGDYLVSKRWIFANEVSVNPKRDSNAYKKIKQHSTDTVFNVLLKKKDQVRIRNYSHWLFFADESQPLRIESHDRRHTVFKQMTPLPKEISNKLSPNENPGYLDTELKNFVSYLRDFKANFKGAELVYVTDAKHELIDLNKSTLELFMEEYREINDIREFCNAYSIRYAAMEFKESILCLDFYNIYLDWCSKNNIQYTKGHRIFAKDFKAKYKIESIRSRKHDKSNRAVYLLSDLL